MFFAHIPAKNQKQEYKRGLLTTGLVQFTGKMKIYIVTNDYTYVTFVFTYIH